MGKKQKYKESDAKLWIRLLCGFLGALMVFGIVFMVITSFLTDSFAAPEDNQKYNVKSREISVGLNYLSSAVPGCTLSSTGMLTVSTNNLELDDITGEVTVSFDGNEYIYNGEISDNTNGVLIIGGYHVRISYIQTAGGGSSSGQDNPVFVVPGASGDSGNVGQGFTKENINEYISGLNQSDAFSRLQVYAFPMYIGSECYIAVGDYATKEEAANLLGELQQNFKIVADIAEPNDNMMTVHTGENRILFETDSKSDLKISSSGNNPLTNGKGEQFYGTFEFCRDNSENKGALRIINTLTADDYVKSVMSVELSSNYSSEMLKACAIVFRTLAYNLHGVHSEQGFDVCSDSHCQKYIGCASVSESISGAVDQTLDNVLTYEKKLIYPVYCISSGSTTVSLSDAIGNNLSYLTSLKTPWDLDNAAFDDWTASVSPSELCRTLNAAGYNKLETSIRSISVDKRSENSLYITEITFTDILDNSVTISGSENIRIALDGIVQSAAFIVGKSGSAVTFESFDENGNAKEETRALSGVVGHFVFSGEGVGSGVGLSFSGAQSLAKQGKTFSDIISVYYPSATLAAVNVK